MITLYNADVLDVLSILDTDSIDTIITSPPYNNVGYRKGQKICGNGHSWKMEHANITYGENQDNMLEADYKEWQVKILNELYRVIKPTGSIFYNHKTRYWKGIADHPLSFISKSKCVFRQEIIWDRKITPAVDPGRLFPMTEHIFWLTKGKPNVYRKQVLKEFQSNIWTILPKKRGEGKPDHPAPFPITIPEQCILLSTQPSDLVLDPFLGSGTTGLAARQLGRSFIGIELNEEYYESAKKTIYKNSL